MDQGLETASANAVIKVWRLVVLHATLVAFILVIGATNSQADDRVPGSNNERSLVLVPIEPVGIGYGRQVRFPEIRDWKSLKIEIEDDECGPLLPCFQGNYEIDGTGIVSLRTAEMSEKKVCAVRTARISDGKLRAIVDDFRRANFLSLWSEYHAGTVDAPYSRISISFDRYRKEVRDFNSLAKDDTFPVPWLAKSLERRLRKLNWRAWSKEPCT